MTHKEWVKAVKHALIDKEMNITQLAVAMDKSPEWARLSISGRLIRPKTVAEISEYLGIENYLES